MNSDSEGPGIYCTDLSGSRVVETGIVFKVKLSGILARMRLPNCDQLDISVILPSN